MTPLTAGAYKDQCIDQASYDLMLDYFYEKHGFSKQGMVEEKLLNELDIS